TPYKKWMNEDVGYIISDEQRKAFLRLSTDEERQNFIEQFWMRRDPTPDTEENEFKEEHYRRIAYANEHYASGIPGWKADRGRIYITFGPPDEIDSHPSGGTYSRPTAEGGGETTTFPFEDWRYRYIEGIGNDVNIEDLEAAISTRITYNILPMLVRIDYVRVTESSVLANITVQFENRDLSFQAKDGVQKSVVNLLGRVSTMTRRPVTTFEKPLEIDAPPDMLQKYAQQRSIYQQSVPLAPGRYRLNIVAKDTVAGTINNYETALDVPHFDEEKLASSSLILADTIEKLPTKSIGGGMFSIGDTKVR